MSNRAIETEIKVKALEQCLTLQNVEQVAAEVGVAPNSIRNWFDNKVLPALPAILVNETPGPKPSAAEALPAAPPTPVPGVRLGTAEDGRPAECPHCHGGQVWKNGVYWVLNWLAVVTFHWFSPERVPVQRFRCAVCGHEIITPARARLTACLRVRTGRRRGIRPGSCSGSWWPSVNSSWVCRIGARSPWQN